jgi:integrase/recombinase XerD
MELFDRFLQERTYLKGVSPETLRYYRWVRHAFQPILAEPTNTGMMELLREIVKVQFLKTEQKVLATFTEEQIKRIIAWKPIGRNQTRVCALALAALDTGLRINELLGLTRSDIDFDNLTLRVIGKGNKHRLVPMSLELRKILFRYASKHEHTVVFCTKYCGKLTPLNVLRDFKLVCNKLGITRVKCSFHTLRHSFAVGYLRRGGNLEFLRRILGHSSIVTTQKYLRSLGVEDLQKVHDGLSLLSR